VTSVRVEQLTKRFVIRRGLRCSHLTAVDRVGFDLVPGRTVALVGESGSGKSTIARMLTRMERPTAGGITVTREDNTPVTGSAYRQQIQMVFQDPFASLNPFHTVAHHIARPLVLHKRTRGRDETRQRVLEMLDRVNLTPPQDIASRRPHELSGGQRQRVAIARALAPGAGVLIADEPVSMLDVSIRLDVLNLLETVLKLEWSGPRVRVRPGVASIHTKELLVGLWVSRPIPTRSSGCQYRPPARACHARPTSTRRWRCGARSIRRR